MHIYFIEGVDGSGKSTLISELKRSIPNVIATPHLSSPSKYLKEFFNSTNLDKQLYKQMSSAYMRGYYTMYFDMLKELISADYHTSKDSAIIFDRSHISELLYGNSFRDETSEQLQYIFKMFKECLTDIINRIAETTLQYYTELLNGQSLTALSQVRDKPNIVFNTIQTICDPIVISNRLKNRKDASQADIELANDIMLITQDATRLSTVSHISNVWLLSTIDNLINEISAKVTIQLMAINNIGKLYGYENLREFVINNILPKFEVTYITTDTTKS